jgi:hypothetical protein
MGEAQRAALGRVIAASIAGVVALALACATTPAPGPAAASADTGVARALCEATCARAIRCDGPRAGKAGACDCGGVRDPRVLRPEWVHAAIACLGESACDSSVDCESAAYRAIGAAPLSWPPVVMRCLARGDTCGGSSATCQRLAALSDEAQAEASACFDQPCEGYAVCFRRFVASRVTPAVPAWK